MNDCQKFETYLYNLEAPEAPAHAAFAAHLETCETCREVYAKNRAIFSGLQGIAAATHPDDDLLMRYAGYLTVPDEPDYDGQFLSLENLQMLKAHTQTCPSCARRLDEMLQEYQSLNEYLEGAGIPDINIGEMPESESVPISLRRPGRSGVNVWEKLAAVFRQKSFLIPAVGMAIIAVLIMINPFGGERAPGLPELAELEQPRFSYLTRSAGNNLQQGLKNLNEGNYTAAIEHLEQYIALQSEDDNAVYGRFACGVAYLYAASESASPLQLQRSIEYLQKITPENANLRLQEDAAWYLGKAYLIKNDPPTARSYFEAVVRLRGRKAAQAQQLLSSLEKYLTNSP